MPNTVTHKLELFEEAILAKAAAERQEAEQVTERMKKAELDKEENRLLNGLYQQIQDQIHQMQTENVKEISRNARDLKKQLYQQREQYLAEIIARARAELAVFSKGPDYPAYLERPQTARTICRTPNCCCALKTSRLPDRSSRPSAGNAQSMGRSRSSLAGFCCAAGPAGSRWT